MERTITIPVTLTIRYPDNASIGNISLHAAWADSDYASARSVEIVMTHDGGLSISIDATEIERVAREGLKERRMYDPDDETKPYKLEVYRYYNLCCFYHDTIEEALEDAVSQFQNDLSYPYAIYCTADSAVVMDSKQILDEWRKLPLSEY